MDKKTFFTTYAPKKAEYDMPDGKKISIVELSLDQRAKMREAITEHGSVHAQALVVCMGCAMLTEADKDVQAVKAMPGQLISGISDAILRLSGLLEEEAEKNSLSVQS